MARGLGKQRLIARFLRLHAETSSSLVLCLNMASQQDNQLLVKALLVEGMDTAQLPRIITNELGATQREALYKQGGVYLVTSRILIVDMLSGKIDVSKIRGVVVNHAHRVTETSTEAFIVRIYRQKNRHGFLKAFSDEPEPLLQGFAKVSWGFSEGRTYSTDTNTTSSHLGLPVSHDARWRKSSSSCTFGECTCGPAITWPSRIT